jgi:hypothetical protein
MKQLYIFFLVTFTIFYSGCSASIDDRFNRQSEKKVEITITPPSQNLEEDFDFTSYETDIETVLIPIQKKQLQTTINKSNLWFTLDDDEISKKTKYVRKKGFRVQILSTDNFNQADSLRSIVYFKTNHKNIYIDYESPFYKVKVGDYINATSAHELGFKLRQLGFQTTLIVTDSVNTIINND